MTGGDGAGGTRKKSKKFSELESARLDNADQTQTLKALLESEERYRSMVENMRELVYICSSDFKISYMNPAMEKRIGKESIGKHCYERIHTFKNRCAWCRFEDVLKGNCYELEVLSPFDNKYYNISSAPMYHVDGTISKMTIYRDITGQKRSERILEEDQRQMRALSQKVISAMEEERERVSRDMHDSLGQMVVAIQLKAGMLMNSLKNGSDTRECESLLNLTEKTTEELERLCKGLRPPVLAKVGLSAALKELVDDTKKIWGRKITSELDGSMDDFIGDIEAINFYRIAQEALNNVIRHSGGTGANVSLVSKNGKLTLEVSDNGKGFEAGIAGEKSRLGLVGMRERADICGGRFAIRSKPGDGTTVTVSISLNGARK